MYYVRHVYAVYFDLRVLFLWPCRCCLKPNWTLTKHASVIAAIPLLFSCGRVCSLRNTRHITTSVCQQTVRHLVLGDQAAASGCTLCNARARAMFACARVRKCRKLTLRRDTVAMPCVDGFPWKALHARAQASTERHRARVHARIENIARVGLSHGVVCWNGVQWCSRVECVACLELSKEPKNRTKNGRAEGKNNCATAVLMVHYLPVHIFRAMLFNCQFRKEYTNTDRHTSALVHSVQMTLIQTAHQCVQR